MTSTGVSISSSAPLVQNSPTNTMTAPLINEENYRKYNYGNNTEEK